MTQQNGERVRPGGLWLLLVLGGVLRRAAAGGGPGRSRGAGLGRARARASCLAGGRPAGHLAAESGRRTPRAEILAVITVRPAELAPHPMSGPRCRRCGDASLVAGVATCVAPERSLCVSPGSCWPSTWVQRWRRRVEAAAVISTAQPDHPLARPAPVSHRCRASGSQRPPPLVRDLQRMLSQLVANIQPPRPRRGPARRRITGERSHERNWLCSGLPAPPRLRP
jgi:hypothetical protein